MKLNAPRARAGDGQSLIATHNKLYDRRGDELTLDEYERVQPPTIGLLFRWFVGSWFVRVESKTTLGRR